VTVDAALIAVLAELTAQRTMVRDVESQAATPPGPALYRTALDVVEKRATAVARSLVADKAVDAATRSAAKVYLDGVEARRVHDARIEDHLLAIAAGWSCPHCKEDVVDACAVSLVSAGLSGMRVELVCGNCQKRSPPTPAGRKHFDVTFGAEVSPTWNPERHGLRWDHR
jgi:hypothetical protein